MRARVIVRSGAGHTTAHGWRSRPASDSVAALTPRNTQESRIGRIARASSTHVVSAFVIMGGWAVLANRTHGAAHALGAGLLQGALSAIVTLGLKRGLELVSGSLDGAWAYVAPPTLGCVVVLVLLVTAHTVGDTPEVWKTIAVPYAASSLYAWVYTAIAVRHRRRGAA